MKNIALIGFMGTGKSTAGKLLSEMLDLQFVDSDEEIERKEGCSVKDIFNCHGESYFRDLESTVIKELSQCTGCVIATGGGVVLSPGNMENLRKNCIIISLKATPEVILKRVGSTGARPLLDVENPQHEIDRILNSRQGLYEGDLIIDTSCMSPDDVAVRIRSFIQSEKHSSSFSMEFGDASCEVVSGSGVVEDIYKFICSFHPEGKVLIISDPSIRELWGGKLQRALDSHYQLDWCIIPNGEEHKNIDSLSQIYDKAALMRLSKDSLIIGFGGGVIGDMSGLASATFMRGIPYVQVPTTLLAQVDSSIGGKTAINHREGKNLIGSFYQPQMTMADIFFLFTLPPREYISGLAEVIKYGIIYDNGFFDYLEKSINDILQLNPKVLTEIVRRSCSIKASIVQQDEKDNGLRLLLNYGHTIGHAIEAATEYKKFLHGEAISLGMEGAAFIAAAMGLISENDRSRQGRLLAAAGLPIRFPSMDKDKVLDLMENDKKVKNGHLRFVLPEALGKAGIYDEVPESLLMDALEQLKND